MAKTVEIDIVVNGKMQKATVSAKKLKKALDDTDKSTQKTTKSTGTLDRNLKGAAQATSNSTKEFSKMSQGMGGLVAVYAQIAAATFAVSAAFQFMKDAFEVRNLIEGQKAFGAVTGVAYQTLTNDIRAATDGMLSFRDAAQAAAIGTAAGLSRGQLEKLGSAAKNVSFALGRDLTDSFNRLVRGVTKAEPELLDELGIVLRLEPAMKAYATAIGKNVKDLNQFEKSQAIANDVLEQAETKFGALQKIMDPSAASLAQFQSEFSDLMNEVKAALVDILIPVFNFLKDNTMALVGALSLIAMPIVKQVLPNFKEMGIEAEKAFQKANTAAIAARQDRDVFRKTSALATGSSADRASVVSTSQARGQALGIQAKGTLQHDKMLSKRQLQIYQRMLNQKTGKYKKFNAQQKIEFRRFLAEQEALHATSEGKRTEIVRTQNMTRRQIEAETNAFIKAGQASLVAATAGAATMMDKALKAMGWIGIALLVYDIGKMLYDWMFPMTEAEKEAEEFKMQLEQITKEQKLLNEELERMVTAINSAEVDMGALALVKQQGQAFQSVDIVKQITEYNKLIGDTSQEAQLARLAIAKTFGTLADISGDTTFLKIYFDMTQKNEKGGNRLNPVLIQQAMNMNKIAVAASTAASRMSDLRKATDQAFASAAPQGLFFGDILTALQAEVKSIDELLPELERKGKEKVNKRIVAALDATKAEFAQREADIDKAFKFIEERMTDQGTLKRGMNVPLEDSSDVLRTDIFGEGTYEELFQRYTMEERFQKVVEFFTAKRAKLEADIAADRQNREATRAALEKKYGEEELATVLELQARYKRLADIRERTVIIQEKQVEIAEKKNTLAEDTSRAQLMSQFDKEVELLRIKDAQLQQAVDQATVDRDIASVRESTLTDNISGLETIIELEEAGLAAKREAVETAQAAYDANKDDTTLQERLEAAQGELQSAEDSLETNRASLDTDNQRLIAAKAALKAANDLLGVKNVELEVGKELNEQQRKLNALKRIEEKQGVAFKLIELSRQQMLIGATSIQKTLIDQQFKLADLEKKRITTMMDIQELAITDPDSDKIKALYLQLEILNQQEEVIKRQQDLTLDTLDKMNEAMQTSFQSGLASLIKGEENDLTKIAATIGMDIATAAADNLAKKMTENIFRKKDDTPEGRIEEAMVRAAEYHGKVLEAVAQNKPIPGYSRTAGGGSVPETAVNSLRSNFDALLGPRALSGPATSRNDTLGQEEVGVVALDKGSWGRFTGALSDLFREQEGETGFVGKLGDVFRTGGSVMRDIFSGLVSSLSAIFSRLFGGGSASGEYAGMLVSAVAAAGTAAASGGDSDGKSEKLPKNKKGIPTPGDGGRYGGVFSKGQKMPGYAFGGIAKGPQSGYPVMMHGKEAIVPLPQGNSIPVELRGAGQQNNVTVNVSVDNQGKVSQDTQATSNDGANLGRAMSVAVQKELQRQKRSGGMLNPYGVA